MRPTGRAEITALSAAPSAGPSTGPSVALAMIITPAMLALSLAVILLLVAACGSAATGDTEPAGKETTGAPMTTGSTIPGDPPQPTEVVLAQSELDREEPAASSSDLRSAALSIESFGSDLYRLLAERSGEGNLVFSPASVAMALAMTYAGAAGITADEMLDALRFELRGDALHQAINSLDNLIESRSWEGEDEHGNDQGVLVRTANSLWAQRDTAFEQLFLDTLAVNYGAGVRLVDYENDPEEARRAINAWVASETEGNITALIAEGALDALVRLVLVNAVYLNATWASQFDPDLTVEGRFTTLSGNEVTVPMMAQSTPLPYMRGDGWQAVELPYLREELAMLVVLPDEGGFAAVERELVSGLIRNTVASLGNEAEVHLRLPRFKFRTQTNLGSALQALGMRSAFDPGAADFSAMTTQESLFVSDVIHEAYIAVDEEGTEAAAATAVVMRVTAALPRVELAIDRPFFFALRDRESGTVLFLGRVTDPTR